MSKSRTRQDSSSALSNYLGQGKELVPSQVPTLRANLQLGLHLQTMKHRMEDVDKRNYPVAELMRDVTTAALGQWEKANPLFRPPIICTTKSLERSLERDWEKAKLASRNRLSKGQKEELESRLDCLWDPLTCRCQPILPCKEAGCLGPKARPPCRLDAHLPSCSCPKEAKIPKLELLYVKSQRAKKTEKEGMQLGLEDVKEDIRQKKEVARKEKDKKGKEKKALKIELEEIELEERIQQDSEEVNSHEGRDEESEEERGAGGTEGTIKERNHMDLSRTASTSMRYELSVRSTSAVTTAFLGDLIEAGELSPRKVSLAPGPRKLQRARNKVLAEASEQGMAQTEEDTIRNVMFDSRIDETKERYFDEETGRFYVKLEKQDHYTLTDGDGRFLTHITKPGKVREEDEVIVMEEEEGADDEGTDGAPEDTAEKPQEAKKPKPAEVVARIIFEWLKLHGLTLTLEFLSADSTNSNTGWRAGIIAWLEKLLGRKVTWLICQLHTNELGLRHLFESLDGKTNSKDGWSGPLGKLLKSVNSLERDYRFKKICLGPELIELSPEVVKDLSTDQHLLYKLTVAVRTGHLPKEVGVRKVGNMVHSRWLTFAESVLLLWMSRHGLEEELLERLESVVTYIVSCYVPMWFQIKVKHSWLEGPQHVLTHLSLLQLQSERIQDILMPYLRTSSWYAHSESILQTLLCSQDPVDRSFAVSKILKLRGREALGRINPRSRKLPLLNEKSKTLQDLIQWKRVHEPLLTCGLNKEEIKSFRDTPMEVSYYCGHTQPIERAVKEVTAASAAVIGERRRDGWIRARAENRELMPVLNTKQDLLGLLFLD
jgi:hypothetical protein